MADINWQPIETAPKDGTRILIYVPGNSFGDDHGLGCLTARWEQERFFYREYRPTGRSGCMELFREEERIGAWVIGGDLWSDSTLELTNLNFQPTYWRPSPEPPA